MAQPSWDTGTSAAAVPSWEQTQGPKPSWETEAEEKPEVGYGTDIAKTTLPSLGRGVVALGTTPGTLGNLMGNAGDWLLGKIAPETMEHIKAGREKMEQERDKSTLGKIEKVLDPSKLTPSYNTAMDYIQGKTGQWYEPQTVPGKIWGGTLEAAPSFAAGGGLRTVPGAIGAGLKALGAGAGGVAGEAAGQGISSALPESWQPYAQGVGGFVGSTLGSLSPAGARRMASWNPMDATRLNMINALDPALRNASTAGQLTGSDFWKRVESYSPKGQAAPAAQEAAFTQGALNRAGTPTAPGAAAPTLGDVQTGINQQIAGQTAIRNVHDMTPAEFAAFRRANAARVQPLQQKVANAAQADPYIESVKDIAYGPNWRTQMPRPGQYPTNISGPRVNALKQDIAGKIGAPSTVGHTQDALREMQTGLNQAYLNSLPPAERARYAQLSGQLQAGHTVENVPYQMGRTTVTPQEIGKSAAGRGDTAMEQYAQQAGNVMTGMPTPRATAPAWFNIGVTGLGGALGGMLGGPVGAGLLGGGSATERMVLAHLMGDPLWKVASGTAGRLAMSKPGQAFLKNQVGTKMLPYTGHDPNLRLKNLLAAPPKFNRPQDEEQ